MGCTFYTDDEQPRKYDPYEGVISPSERFMFRWKRWWWNNGDTFFLTISITCKVVLMVLTFWYGFKFLEAIKPHMKAWGLEKEFGLFCNFMWTVICWWIVSDRKK